MTQQYNQSEHELGWDDEIVKDSSYTVLTPGEYWFIVESFERARHTPSAQNTNPNKLPACNKAVLKLKVVTNDGNEATLTHNLFLHSRTEGMISAFFGAIGQKKHGEPLRMNWQSVIGQVGVAKVKNNESRNGNVYNEVDQMIYSEDVDNTKVLNQRPSGAVSGQSTYQQPQQQTQQFQQPTNQQPMQQNVQQPQQGFQQGNF